MTSDRRTQRPKLIDRLGLRLSSHRLVDGLWIGTFESEPEASAVLQRIEQALLLIKTHDPHRYDRLRRDLARIWVRLLPDARAHFSAALRACVLDSRFVLDVTVSAAELATSIVHEATHARIDQCGLTYQERLRERIEVVCLRREIAFAERLPNGADVRRRLEASLAAPPPREYWTDTAFEERCVGGSLDILRQLGVPERMLPWVRRGRTLVGALRRLMKRVVHFRNQPGPSA